MEEMAGCNLLTARVIWYCISRTASWVQRFSVKSSRWRNLSGHFFEHGSNSCCGRALQQNQTCFWGWGPACTGVLSTEQEAERQSFLVLVCLTVHYWSPCRKGMINRKKFGILNVKFFFHWSCFYCCLGDFTGWKLGKLNFSGARCEVLSINILCAYALLGNFIHRFSEQL